MDLSQLPGEMLVLLVGRPGRGRDALAELLRAQAGPLRITFSDTGLLALKATRERLPGAVIIAGGLPDAEVIELVFQLKQAHPALACLALAETTEVQREALLAGADCVMPAGSPWGQLLPVILKLISNA